MILMILSLCEEKKRKVKIVKISEKKTFEKFWKKVFLSNFGKEVSEKFLF